jgi:hypothetical protein
MVCSSTKGGPGKFREFQEDNCYTTERLACLVVRYILSEPLICDDAVWDGGQEEIHLLGNGVDSGAAVVRAPSSVISSASVYEMRELK